MRVEHGDQVARVGDERPEPRLALAAVEVLGQRRALDGERDLRGERLERVDELAGDARPASRGRAGRAPRRGPRAAERSTASAVDEVEAGRAPPRGVARAGPASRPGRLAQPAVGVRRHVPLAVVAGRGGDDRALAVHQRRDGRVAGSPTRAQDGRDRSLVDLLATAGGDELDARPSQRAARARRRAPPGARGRPCGPRREGRGAPTRRSGRARPGRRSAWKNADAGRDQAGAGEQAEAERGETRARLVRRLLERAHRRVERGCAPEQVVGDPADVVAQLVVVRVGEERVGVGGVDGEQRRRCCRPGGRRPARACPLSTARRIAAASSRMSPSG